MDEKKYSLADVCEEDRHLVKDFCQKFKVELDKIDYTGEASERELVIEPMYFFNDSLGGYTRKGLEASLNEENKEQD